ncbi:MAG: Na/Pi cotransporter family protein [Clostridia bacterium]|nr:Na/Pi cotransporter family protein [Clostridia bacterium]
MGFDGIVALIGGVALFLFGMSIMGDSLKKVAGSKMEMILYKLSGNTLKAILLGTGVTAVVQSSSATSVMTVGFVNSGMMKVRQAIGVILGAILGTSVTGWVLCLNSLGGAGVAKYFTTEILTGVVALIGVVFWMFSKKKSRKNIGGILLGFAVLMYGMSAMAAAVSPLRDSESFIKLITNFSNPLLGILAGLIFTSIIQSASAAVGILQALSMTGVITFDVAFPIILGIGIGASVPVILSALGADTNGKRTAFSYLIADVLGALICGTLFYVLNSFIGFGFTGATMTMVSIALLNTVYRLVTVIILAPAVGLLEKLVCRLFPESADVAEERADMDKLESRFLTHPAIAIQQSKEVIDSMAAKAYAGVVGAVSARRKYSKAELKKVYDTESLLDRYEDKLGTYLYMITTGDIDREQSKEVGEYMRVLSDYERISDHARNIADSVEEIEEKKINFSGDAEGELEILEDAVCEITAVTIKAFVDSDKEEALKVDPLDEVISFLCAELKSRHVDRVRNQECTLENGFVFNDMLSDYERIAAHCSNVAVDIIEAGSDEVQGHEYHRSIDYKNNEKYTAYIAEYEKKYAL